MSKPEWAELLDQLYQSEYPEIIKKKHELDFRLMSNSLDYIDTDDATPAFRLYSLNLIEVSSEVTVEDTFPNILNPSQFEVMVLSEEGLRLASDRYSDLREESILVNQTKANSLLVLAIASTGLLGALETQELTTFIVTIILLLLIAALWLSLRVYMADFRKHRF
jgi:hypothetical protein